MNDVILDEINWKKSYQKVFSSKKEIGLVVLDSCQSTMDIARSLIRDDYPQDFLVKGNQTYTACFSLAQTKGRGRKSRSWYSDNSGGIYLSLIDHNALEPMKLQGLSLIIGLAIVNFLKDFDIDSGIKWPNDVLVRGKKIAGTLIESVSRADKSTNALIIGIGLNLNQLYFPPDINATSVYLEKSEFQNYEKSSLMLLNYLIEAIVNFKQHGFTFFRDDCWNYSLFKGKLIENKENQISGIAIGISETGALLVKQDDQIKEIIAGDVGLL